MVFVENKKEDNEKKNQGMKGRIMKEEELKGNHKRINMDNEKKVKVKVSKRRRADDERKKY